MSSRDSYRFHQQKSEDGSKKERELPKSTNYLGIIDKKGIMQLVTPDGKVLGDPYHKIEYYPDLDNILVGTLGALSYIIDPETGQRASDGYHKIYKKGGGFFGELGASESKIKLTPQFYRNKVYRDAILNNMGDMKVVDLSKKELKKELKNETNLPPARVVKRTTQK